MKADLKSKLDFSTIQVEVDENHVNDQGEPRKDVLIFSDRLIVHPKYEDRLKRGLALFFKNIHYIHLINQE